MRDTVLLDKMAQITSDGRTTWVNGAVSMVARFGPNHCEVYAGDTTCNCVYSLAYTDLRKTTELDWKEFKRRVKEHHGIDVPDEHRPAHIQE